MKQKELEIMLQSVKPHPNPSPELEQYSTPANVAAGALYFAYGLGDIEGKKIVDPGCGTGMLAIGAKLLGATDVVALDIDEAAVETAMDNARKLGVDICLLTMDFASFPEKCDTVITNPPFGAQRGNIHADTFFLEQATSVGDVVYSFHKSETLDFLVKKVGELQCKITHLLNFRFPIPRMFKFHQKDKKDVEVVLLRISR